MAKKFLTGLNLVVLDVDPSTGSEGELYFNSSASVAKIYQAGAWSVLGAGGGGGAITVSTTEPESPEVGDGWYKNDTGELYIYDGTYWVEVNGTISLTQEQVQDYVAPLFTNATNTNVIATYDDANNVINLNTSGSLISVDSIRYPDFITFDTTPEIIPTEQGSIYWDSGDTGLRVLANATSILLGQEQYATVKNATGSSIAKGKVVYINGAQGQRPTITLADADTEPTSSKTFGMTAESIADGAEGVIITEGILRGINTDGLTEGGAVWLSSTAGNFTQTMPTQPVHNVFLGYVVKAHESSGEIYVKIQNGYELNELHNVLLSASVSNNELLSYSSTSGLWINKTPAQAGLATSADLIDYLLIDDAALLYQPLSTRLTSITTVENVAGFLVSDGSTSYTIDVSEYLTTSDASATYLEQIDAAGIYLTQTDAENTYLTTASAASTYQPLDEDLTAISSVSGSGFLRRNITNTWEFDSNTYLTTYDAGTTYQPIGNYATINGVETLTNKTMSSAFVNDILTFDDGANSSTIDVTGDNLTINGYDNLYLTTTIGSIILQPDHFVKIYDEYVATQEWVNFQDYLTEASASTIYQPIGSYSTTSHNHSLDSLSNVVITGTPSDGQAIVWDTATSKWVNETVSGGASYPDQTGNDGKFLQTNSGSVSWQNVDLTGYLTTESDTLETVTDRGATSSNAITISNTTQATNATSGALIVSGGVGVAKDVWIDGNLHVAGTTTTENTRTVATHDNLIYLNAAIDTTITNAVYSSGSITYTADNTYTAGMDIRITGVDPSGFNISTGDSLTVASATPTQFIVVKSDPGASYISGGTAHAKEEANPDLGFAGGYYSGGYAHAGLFRDASDGIFKFFKGYTPEPDEAVNIDTGHASFALADIAAAGANFSGSVSLANVDISGIIANGNSNIDINTSSSIDILAKSSDELDYFKLTVSPYSISMDHADSTRTFMIGANGTIQNAEWAGDAISYSYGGTGLSTLGTAGQVLTVNSGATGLEWANVSGGSSFTNSSEFAALISDETGSGSVVFSDSPTLITPNIGAATGTSLTTTGNVVSHVDISTPTFVTNAYTLSSTDDGKLLMLDNSSTVGTLLIPTDATYNFPIGTQINVVQQGTGLITIDVAGIGITTVNATPGKKLRAQWSSAAIVKTAANTWLLMGDLTV